MSLPKVVSRADWLTARNALLAQEKELTRRRDALSAQRRELPMVEVDKDYVFTGPGGEEKSLLDLFDGRLRVTHSRVGCRAACSKHVPKQQRIVNASLSEPRTAVRSRTLGWRAPRAGRSMWALV